jgi:hypothetical protein
MLTYSRPDMFFWIACFNVFKCINSNVISSSSSSSGSSSVKVKIKIIVVYS